MKIYIKIKDKYTGDTSERVNINDFIYGNDIEFKFKDGSTLPYNDFLCFKGDYELIYIVERK